MSIEKVLMWQTKDGELYGTLYDAQGHVVDHVAKVFDKILRLHLTKVDGLRTANELFCIVNLLTKDYDTVALLMKELNEAYDDCVDEVKICG